MDQKKRLAKRYSIDVVTGCWLWFGHRDEEGYGRVRAGNRKVYVHRVMHELYIGPIPAGLQVDHLCGVRNCVNPAHLEAVTPRVNVLRSASWAAVNAEKSHCIHGHALVGDNLAIRSDGNRSCRECGRIRCRRWYARQHG